MIIRVNLGDIIEGMGFQSDESTSYVNKSTGKAVTISEEEFRAAGDDEPIDSFPEWQHENIRIAKRSNNNTLTNMVSLKYS